MFFLFVVETELVIFHRKRNHTFTVFPILIMNPIEEEIIRILYIFKRSLLVCLLLEIIDPDIMFLSDIQNAISWQPSLLICIGIQSGFVDRNDRNMLLRIMMDKRIERI